MATNIRVGIDVSDNGTTERVNRRVRELRAMLREAQDAAAAVNVGGTAGSRRIAAAEVADYGRMRGAAGSTGASSRDFANQAQGLGGLVRLYATFAANIFAVSAAFGGLREAMNTTNMVRGLDMLGAASGQNLGTLSKRLVETTSGALSMRDAMESVAKATSAGMGQKDLLRLTEVAKNASSVLGVNLPDAMSRLTRAVTKLEPELLDELGIMTRIEPAVEAYARQTGRAASSLSQMERQQAFLNAVLAEGEQKFGAIGATVTNPYDKLLAALKNTLQTGLEFVNKFLAPIVDLLASSPKGLALALGALTIGLVRQALPALTQFRAGLQRTTDAARDLSIRRAQDAAEANAKINQMSLRDLGARADAEIARVDAAEKKIQELRANTLNKSTAAYKLLQKTAQEVTDAELANVRRRADIAERRGLTREAAAYREVADAQEASRAAEAAYSRREQEVRDEQRRSIFYQQTQTAALRAQESATRSAIVSNAAYNAGLIGVTNSWRLMNEEINQAGLQLNRFQRAALQARAGLAILGGAAAALGSILNSALGWIGLIITAVGILDSVLSEATKEINEAKNSIDLLKDSAKATTRTIDTLLNTTGNRGSIQEVSALANTIRELGDSAQKAIEDTQTALGKMGFWERVASRIADFFGGGLANNLAENIGKSLNQAIRAFDVTPLSEKAREQFSKVLNTTDLSATGIEKAFKALDPAKQKQVSNALQELGQELSSSANKLSTFNTAAQAVTKTYDQFIQSTAVSSPLFKLGAELEDLALSMNSLTNAADGIREIDAALLELTKDPKKAILFGPDFIQNLINIRGEFKTTTQDLAGINSAINRYTDAISVEEQKLQTFFDEIRQRNKKLALATNEEIEKIYSEGTTSAQKRRNEILQESRRIISIYKFFKEELIAEGKETETTGVIVKARDLFAQGIQSALEKSAKYIAQALGDAVEKARLNLQRTRIESLTGIRRSQAEFELQKQEIDIRIKTIETNIDLILVQEKLTAAIEISNALETLDQAKAKGDQKQITKAETQLEVAQLVGNILNISQGKNLREVTRTQLLSDEISPEVKTGTQARLAAAGRATAQQEAALIGEKSQKDVLELKQPLKDLKAINAEAEKFAKLRQDTKQAELSLLNATNSITGEITQAGIQLQNNTEQQNLLNRLNQELNRLAERRLEIEQGGNNATEVKLFNQEREATLDRQRIESLTVASQISQRNLSFELQQNSRIAEVDRARQDVASSRRQLEFDALTEQTQAYNNLYGVVNSFALLQQDQLARQQAQLQLTRESAVLEFNLNEKRKEADARKQAVVNRDSEAGKEAISRIEQEFTRQQNLTAIAKQGLQDQYNQRLQILDITKKVNAEQERYNSLLQASTGIAESLKGIFDGAADSMKNLADAVGTLVTKTVEYGITSEKNQNALILNQDAIIKKQEEVQALREADKPTDQAEKDLIKLEEARGDQIKKNIKDEITGAAQIAGASKKLFKEKTVAYKLLAATEKVLHVTRLAMDAKEIISDGLKTAANASNSAIRGAASVVEAGINGVAAVVKSIASLPFPFNIAAGAVTATVVGALLSSIGGKKPNASGSAPTGEQRREVQGTAMGFNEQGQRVQTSRGVFGDTSAKSDSIDASLKILRDNSVDGLSTNNEMLKALQSIEKSIGNAAKGLYGVQGLRTGSMFGTIEGSQSGGGLLGSGFLASKTSRSISDAGILIEGSFADLASEANKSALDFFEQITVTKKSWYGKKKTWTETNRKEVDDATSEFFRDIFGGATNLYVEIGKKAGVGQAQIQEVLKGFDLTTAFAGLRGLKGEELQQELNAVISSILDQGAEKVFGAAFDQFQKFGEGLLETVIRVTDTNRKVTQQLKNVGFADLQTLFQQRGISSQQALELSYGITETLVETAGGLDQFLSLTNKFRQNFLTQAQQLEPVRQSVQQELNALGLGFVKTIEDFALEFQKLDPTTQTNTISRLLNLQDNFLKVAEADKKLKEEQQDAQQKITDEAERLNRRLLELQGDTIALREKELETLQPTNKALQQRIWALEDQQAAAKALQSGLNNLAQTIRQQVEALRNYGKSLDLSANTTLTSAQQYLVARQELDSLLQTIRTPATTADEIAARNKAISSLTGSTDKLLGLSKELFASGTQYTQDFITVKTLIDQVSSSLEVQLTDAEKQLSELQTANTFLEKIDQASKTTNELLSAYLAAGGIPLPSASYASGTSYVPKDMIAQVHRGERIIPAVDNFRLTTQFTNKENYTREMLTEIKRLNEKINSLERTVAEGAVINAQATDRNTEELAQVFVDNSGKAVQAVRLQTKASIK